MDVFNAMRTFIRIVERRSFTRAAEDLGVPRSTATEAVKALEARLRVQLLQRTTRTVVPTLDGEAYYAQCTRLLSDLEDAESAFSGDRGKNHDPVVGGPTPAWGPAHPRRACAPRRLGVAADRARGGARCCGSRRPASGSTPIAR
jgi:DNA-binding transcriptional LysR family regulator